MTIIPVLISKVETMGDKTLRIKLDTNELTNEAMADVMIWYGKFGNIIFKENATDFKNEDLLNIPDAIIDKDEKTPSQRLRNTMFIYWEQKGKPTKTFDEFYRKQMELLISEWLN